MFESFLTIALILISSKEAQVFFRSSNLSPINAVYFIIWLCKHNEFDALSVSNASYAKLHNHGNLDTIILGLLTSRSLRHLKAQFDHGIEEVLSLEMGIGIGCTLNISSL